MIGGQQLQLSSPDQQPQSTSVDERPDSSSKDVYLPAPAVITTRKKKNDNRILKQLLSQEDEDEDADTDIPTVAMVATATATTTTASVSSDSTQDEGSVNLEKNEAEPKKTDNMLLKVGGRGEEAEIGRVGGGARGREGG